MRSVIKVQAPILREWRSGALMEGLSLGQEILRQPVSLRSHRRGTCIERRYGVDFVRRTYADLLAILAYLHKL